MFWLIMALIIILIWLAEIGVEELMDEKGDDRDHLDSS
jgi:hypothetical protein